MTTGATIRQMRTNAGLSQAQLARRSGVGRTVINAYERDTREPAATTLVRLAEACGFRLDPQPIPSLDLKHNAKIFGQVLDLAEKLPHHRRGPLTFPPLVYP